MFWSYKDVGDILKLDIGFINKAERYKLKKWKEKLNTIYKNG